jgi:hypothetical protein
MMNGWIYHPKWTIFVGFPARIVAPSIWKRLFIVCAITRAFSAFLAISIAPNPPAIGFQLIRKLSSAIHLFSSTKMWVFLFSEEHKFGKFLGSGNSKILIHFKFKG